MAEIRVSRDGDLGWVVFDRPQRHNAMTAPMWAALPEILTELDTDERVRVIILRGAGQDAFVSGADISELQQAQPGPPAASYQNQIEAAFEAIASVSRPVVAMIHGACMGGGAAIALHADLRYAADDAVFAIPAARLGLSYGVDNTKTLIDVVGPAAAREILYTGRRYDAAEALRLGAYHGVFPKAELEPFVRRTAEQIARNAPLSVQSAKVLIHQWSRPTPDRDVMSASEQQCLSSDDAQEGMRAFPRQEAADVHRALRPP